MLILNDAYLEHKKLHKFNATQSKSVSLIGMGALCFTVNPWSLEEVQIIMKSEKFASILFSDIGLVLAYL